MKARSLILCCLATMVASSGALGFDVKGGGEEQERLAAIAEDIEIMQRLLGKALSSHHRSKAGQAADGPLSLVPLISQFSDRSNQQKDNERVEALYALAANQYAGQLRQSARFNVAGYYVAGVGTIFTFNLPASYEQTEISPEAEAAKDDLWTQTEGEVRGTRRAGSRILGATTHKKLVLNEDALDESIDVLLEAVGKFGLRIEGLSASDSIVLAARLEGAGTTVWTNELLLDTARSSIATALGPAAHRLTIRIPVSAIRDFAEGDGELFTLRERSEITRYAIPATAGLASRVR